MFIDIAGLTSSVDMFVGIFENSSIFDFSCLKPSSRRFSNAVIWRSMVLNSGLYEKKREKM